MGLNSYKKQFLPEKPICSEFGDQIFRRENMKKLASIFLVLAVLLSFTVQTVLAQGTLELLETRNDKFGNVIFVFRFTGDFNKNDFKGGTVSFGDYLLDLNCNIADAEEGIVQCTTSRVAGGHNVQINLAGFIFNDFVPERRSGGGGGGGSTAVCYNVYDIDEGQEGAFWFAFETHCPDDVPSPGELLDDFPGPFGGIWDYYFGEQSPLFCIRDSVDEPAYYVACGDGD
jgi:hypothetical protein